MFWLTSGESNFDFFTLRSRYQLGVTTPTYNVLFENGIYLNGTIELFWTLETSFLDNLVNRIRYDLGVGTKISDAWWVELHYVLQDGRMLDQIFQNPFGSEEHILRLRLFYHFN